VSKFQLIYLWRTKEGLSWWGWSWLYGSWIFTTKRCVFNPVHGEVYNIKVCHWLATGLWCSPGTPVPSTNKTDRHDITEILLNVALNTINQTKIKQEVRTYIISLTHNGTGIKKTWELELAKSIYYILNIMIRLNNLCLLSQYYTTPSVFTHHLSCTVCKQFK